MKEMLCTSTAYWLEKQLLVLSNADIKRQDSLRFNFLFPPHHAKAMLLRDFTKKITDEYISSIPPMTSAHNIVQLAQVAFSEVELHKHYRTSGAILIPFS